MDDYLTAAQLFELAKMYRENNNDTAYKAVLAVLAMRFGWGEK